MSNLTDFFSAGGGGGGVGQTITVGDISYPNARPISDIDIFFGYQGANNSYMSYLFNGFSSADPEAYSANGAGSLSDWVTVADITSSSNGGALYGAYTWFRSGGDDHISRVVEMRVTIDGTATSFATSARNCYNFSIAFLGPLGKIIGSYTGAGSSGASTGVLDMSFGTLGGDQGRIAGWNYDATNPGYYSNLDANAGFVPVVPINAAMFAASGYPFVYFSSTCKVEIKINRDNSVDNHYTYIKLF